MSLKATYFYFKTYWLSTAFFGYLVMSTLLKSFTSIDLTIPCFIKYFTGHKCLGCGLTTAVTHLLRLDFQAAFKANALVFIVLPALGYLFIRHWLTFQRKQTARKG